VDAAAIEGTLAFLREAERLKTVLRSGHTSGGRPESTAEHSWRLCLAALVLAEALGPIDVLKLLKICVVHDLGEALAGDVPAPRQIPGDGRAMRERADLAALTEPLPPGPRAEIRGLWEEYEAASSPEAVVAKGLDKLETILQHNQGLNPPGFDYDFNLGYGRGRTDAHPLLARIRESLDAETRARHEAGEREARERAG
jgi:putative hydrolases of HD superfamily